MKETTDFREMMIEGYSNTTLQKKIKTGINKALKDNEYRDVIDFSKYMIGAIDTKSMEYIDDFGGDKGLLIILFDKYNINVTSIRNNPY